MRDGEIDKLRVGLPGRDIVITVVAVYREIGRPHRLAKEIQTDPRRRAEQLLHQRGLLRGIQIVPDDPGRGIGERGAESVHHLVLRRLIHRDDRRTLAPARPERHRWSRLEQHGLVARGQSNLCIRTRRRKKRPLVAAAAGRETESQKADQRSSTDEGSGLNT